MISTEEMVNSVGSEHSVDNWLQQETVGVTGGRGSLGRKLVERLLVGGAAKVVTLDRRLPANNETLDNPTAHHVVGNIMNPAELESAFSDCTLVFHLAVLVHAENSVQDPVSYFQVNGLATAHVLETCRRLGIRRVVYTSTSHVYGIPRELPIGEDHPTIPLSPYAASKLCGEHVLQGFAASHPLSCVVARLANIYGRSFTAETVIGTALDQALAGGPIKLRNLTPIRDFIHVDDVVEALVRLAGPTDREPGCWTFNISTGQGWAVSQIAEILAEIAQEAGLRRPEVVQTDNGHVETVPALVLDNRRLLERTGWQPRISLPSGLRFVWQEVRNQTEGEL